MRAAQSGGERNKPGRPGEQKPDRGGADGRGGAAEHVDEVFCEPRPERRPARIHAGRKQLSAIVQDHASSRSFDLAPERSIFANRRTNRGMAADPVINRAPHQHELAGHGAVVAIGSLELCEVLTEAHEEEPARDYETFGKALELL